MGRNFGTVSKSFWTRGTGMAMRGDKNAQIVACFLMTCEQAGMTGIVSIALVTLAHHTGLTLEETRAGLDTLTRLGFAQYDDQADLCWVPNMAHYQVGPEIKSSKGGRADTRLKVIRRELSGYKGHPFYTAFLQRYGNRYLLFDLVAELSGRQAGISPQLDLPLHATPVMQRNADRIPLSNEFGVGFGDGTSDAPWHGARSDTDLLQSGGCRGETVVEAPFRPDVRQVFEAWREAFAFEVARLKTDNAAIIATAIDEHGLEACIVVVRNARFDAMVSGKADENGHKHESLRYILENHDTFVRIHRDAIARTGVSRRSKHAPSAASIVDEAKNV